MKYIKLFEKYSLPNSVEKLANFLTNYILIEFDKWISRKGLANWTDDLEIKVPFTDNDFPVNKIKLKLTFVRGDEFSRSGYSTPTNIEKDGSVDIDISIKLYIPFNKGSFNEEETKTNMDDAITHELLHSYQYYKIESKGIKQHHNNLALSHTILGIYGHYSSYSQFAYILHTLYVVSSKDERAAFLSQLHTQKGTYWIEDFNRMYDMSFDEFISIFEDGFKKDGSIDIDEKLFYDTFISWYEYYIKEYKEPIDKKLLKCKNFNELIKYLYDIFQREKRDMRNKINKIEYSKK